MQTLPEKYSSFFDLLEFPPATPRPRYKSDNTYFMGIDAEWYEKDGRNVVLSYQIATVSRRGAKNIIKYVPEGKRLTLAELVELGIRSVDGEVNDLRGDTGKQLKTYVILISHHFTAEWSVLADRDEPHITSKLALVRKSPITNHPIKLTLDNKHVPVNVLIFDTMLLAPATHQSLKKLSELLGEEQEKIPITQYYIERMNLYLRDNPEDFEHYALRDSEACVKLFFLLQENLNKLAYAERSEENKLIIPDDFKLGKLFRTLASAGVTGFKEQEPDFPIYLEQFQDPRFTGALRLFKRGYHGGRNESYFVGRTVNFPETKNNVWIDLDLSSCYPTAMALYPQIDTDGKIDLIPLTYKINERVVKELLDDNIAPKIVQEAQAALNDSTDEFEKYLSKRTSKIAAKIRSSATVINNRLINRWRKHYQTEDKDNELYLIPGVARVRFEFPSGTQFPCLPIRHPQFGLIYPLNGETTVPVPEILLALDAGAKIEAITSVELPIKRDDNDALKRPFFPYLSTMIAERKRYKKDKDNLASAVLEKLLKEFVNGMYGKTSQAINSRDVYQPRTGEMVPLGPSEITEPVVAALTTSLARAALSATLLAVERYNLKRPDDSKLTVISATTDGFLVGVPCSDPDYSVAEYYTKNKNETLNLNKGVDEDVDGLLNRFGCSGLMTEMMSILPIQQMQRSRQELTNNPNFLEIKHLADEIVSVKTRGQIGLLKNGEIPLLARFGQKPPLSEEIVDPEEYKRVMETGGTVRNKVDGKWLLDHLERIENGRDLIDDYTFITLTSFRNMIDSDIQKDLVKKVGQRKLNFDYDWKRRLPEDSPYTVPYASIHDMKLHRNQMEAIRRTGHVARTERVYQRVSLKGRNIRYRGGEQTTLVRQFLRGLLQGHLTTNPIASYGDIANTLNTVWTEVSATPRSKVWNRSDIKNAKGGKWEPGTIYRSLPLLTLLEPLCNAFGADLTQVSAILFAAPEHEEQRRSQIEQVVRAIVLAPRQGIEPFRQLYLDGQFPTKSQLLTIYAPLLTEGLLEQFCRGKFIPGQRHSGEYDKFQQLFRRLGLKAKDALACARSISPAGPPPTGRKFSRTGKRCLESFVIALLQSDISSQSQKPGAIVKRLSRFGLTRGRYYQLRDRKFTPNDIPGTTHNSQQIRRIAKALDLNPQPFLEALLDR